MDILLQLISAVVALTIVGYAQARIAQFTAGTGKILLARLILLLAGAAFGYTLAQGIEPMLQRALVFIHGFGLVHFPAAVILYIKDRRGAGKS